jgi:hypothetical protein
MARPKAKSRKLVSISEPLVEGMARISKAKGESMNKVVEDSLRQSVRLNEDGYDLEQVTDFFNAMQAHKVLGGVFLPSSVLDYLVETVYPEGREQLLAKWFESGRWNGKYLKEKFDNPLETFGRFLELSRWDLNEVEVKDLGDSVKIRCVSTVLSNAGTELLAKFIQGVAHGLGYETKKNDCLKGMILLEFRR